jgi:hypothetical protein
MQRSKMYRIVPSLRLKLHAVCLNGERESLYFSSFESCSNVTSIQNMCELFRYFLNAIKVSIFILSASVSSWIFVACFLDDTISYKLTVCCVMFLCVVYCFECVYVLFCVFVYCSTTASGYIPTCS